MKETNISDLIAKITTDANSETQIDVTATAGFSKLALGSDQVTTNVGQGRWMGKLNIQVLADNSMRSRANGQLEAGGVVYESDRKNSTSASKVSMNYLSLEKFSARVDRTSRGFINAKASGFIKLGNLSAKLPDARLKNKLVVWDGTTVFETVKNRSLSR